MGLHIVNRQIVPLGRQISIKSSDNQGITFTLDFPLTNQVLTMLVVFSRIGWLCVALLSFNVVNASASMMWSTTSPVYSDTTQTATETSALPAEPSEVLPSPVGGMEAIYNGIEYPEIEYLAGKQGIVRVRFYVSETGTVENIRVVKSLSPRLDSAAVAAIREVAFHPGMQNGTPVRVQMELPIGFLRYINLDNQHQPDSHQHEDIYLLVDEMPEIIGGMQALYNRVSYPARARQQGLEGRVVLQYLVDTQGRVVDPIVVLSPHPLLSNAALNALKGVRFTPGKQQGEHVPVLLQMPIVFRLQQ